MTSLTCARCGKALPRVMRCECYEQREREQREMSEWLARLAAPENREGLAQLGRVLSQPVRSG